ncbi:PREDICTED: uncharacterized protein LOC108780253 isoform X1 [Cyphomyrmex costatus]|uniref:uncharacterized protein LOC108780253 isoform X1 n=1 Tax=Cyphomyrmex costatus TaxID=456900 RepID=UPI0008522ACD|nr:PREDICTED: uncharacterized protein LOC108780253 isoform X1 [Cyphomyrmex costatus]XP_018403394.1 PREDICTED: uncharacterized protein LOC108780253 isoform X1 [Cyphomyrmex costatus]
MYRDRRFRENQRPVHRSKKRKFYGNRYIKISETSPSTSSKKITGSDDFDVVVIPTHVYSIINFNLVFSALSNILKCKICDGDVTFGKKDEQGLGFQLAIQCHCGDNFINSCARIGNKEAYEINRKFVFIMRLLGIGLHGINCFIGLMDLGKSMNTKTYYAAIENIFRSTKAVFDEVVKKAGREEKEQNIENGFEEDKFIVSGDGSWRKRGFSSLFGVITLIGHFSNKVLDLVVKSSFCKACVTWKNKLNTAEYENWYSEHKEECSANHAGKMEVNAILEMFARAEDIHDVKYKQYIGNGGTKTFKTLLKQDSEVEKKECVNHVQKRMAARLRNLKITNKSICKENVGNLTNKLINDFTVYYGLAIKHNPNSVENMINDVWATYEHKISTNEKPMHDCCPPGPNSWCKWRRAEAVGTLDDFDHPLPLNDKVQQAIRPIFEDLSSWSLLNRCRGSYTQNDHESYDKTIWQFAPKHILCDSQIVTISAYLAACIFNEGFKPILKIMQTMGITIGPYADLFASKRDTERLREAMTLESVEENVLYKNEELQEPQHFEEVEGLLYGPGIIN